MSAGNIPTLIVTMGVFILPLCENLAGGDFMWSTSLRYIITLPILVAAFCCPLGNRKRMALCPEAIGTMERVFGMVLCSLPFWLIVAVAAFARTGLPSGIGFVGLLLVVAGMIANSLVRE